MIALFIAGAAVGITISWLSFAQPWKRPEINGISSPEHPINISAEEYDDIVELRTDDEFSFKNCYPIREVLIEKREAENSAKDTAELEKLWRLK